MPRPHRWPIVSVPLLLGEAFPYTTVTYLVLTGLLGAMLVRAWFLVGHHKKVVKTSLEQNERIIELLEEIRDKLDRRP